MTLLSFFQTWDNLETTDGKRNIAAAPGGNKEREQLKKIKTKTLINSYAECYPGYLWITCIFFIMNDNISF